MYRKLGPHIIGGTWQRLGKPCILKVGNVSVDYVRQLRQQVGRQTLIVVRWIDEPINWDDPVRDAQDWLRRHTAEMAGMTAYGSDTQVVFEGLNEVPRERQMQHVVWEMERLAGAHAIRRRSAVGSWSVGVPDFPDWAVYQPVLNAMRSDDVVAVHEYWADEADLRDPGRWHFGRFSLVPQLRDKKIIVTEAGRDLINGRGGPWQSAQCNSEQYLNEFQVADDFYCQFPNVLGWVAFTIGQSGDRWAKYDCGPIWDKVVERTQAWTEEVPVVTGDKVILPIVNTQKAWYTADELFGEYDDHPARARDWNLESMGNTDLGEPLCAPCDGWIVYAGEAGVGHGIVVSMVAVVDGQLVNWHWKHLQHSDVRQWQAVKQGEPVGAIGTASGKYSAHLHEEIVLDAITGPTQDWRDTAYNYCDPAQFYLDHGVSQALIRRLTHYDGD